MRVLCFFLIPMMVFSTIEAVTVLITGANRGIGFEFAKQFEEKGYHVIGTARKPQEAAELRSLGVRVEQLDVTNPKSIEMLARRLDGIPIDILINNSGIFLDRNSSLQTIKPDEMSKTFAVNTTGPLLVTQALLPNLRSGHLKQVVNISSALGSIENNSGRMYAYRSSKAALNQLSKTMSIELGNYGFVVIAIHPGWVRTDMGGSGGTYSPEQSVSNMIDVIDKLSKKSNGRFLDLHGDQLPW